VLEFVSKASWRRETTLIDFIQRLDSMYTYHEAEWVLAQMVEHCKLLEWFLPPRVEADEDLRATTPLRYRVTDKGLKRLHGNVGRRAKASGRGHRAAGR